MIKTLAILYLLGATCFSSASPTGGKSIAGHQQLMGIQNQNQQAATSWQSTVLPNGNRLENGPLSRSQENENEINDSENPGAGDENAAVTEDKQLPPQAVHQQQPQSGPSPAPLPNPNRRPIVNQQQVNPIPYAAIYSNGNHVPGVPITQYSGIQMVGYQKEQTGQAPISQQQQIFYSGGSNSIPMMIYSDSERPPITMFYLAQGDKQLQGAVKTGDFIPNLQPIGQQQMFYSQSLSPFNMPMPIYDPIQVSPVNSWDRQYPIFETYSSPQNYHPSNNVVLKNKENQKADRVMAQKTLQPKAANFGEMRFGSPLYAEPISRAAFMMPPPESLIQNTNAFNSRAIDSQLVEPWMMPQRQRLAKLESMRSVMNPFWGIEPKQAMSYEWNEPMERSISNNWDSSLLGSRYTTLPTSPYTSGGYSSGQNSYSSAPSSSSYSTNGGQHGSSGYTSSAPSGSSYSTNGGQHGSSGYSSSAPSGSSYSTNGGQHSSFNQGAQNQYNSNKKPQNQLGGTQGSSSYLSPGSSHVNSGSNYGHSSGMKGPGLLGVTGPQQSPNTNQNVQPSFSTVQGDSNKFEKTSPIITIVPVGVMMPSHKDQSGLNKNQLYPESVQSHPQSAASHPSSNPRNALLGSQFGLGGLGLGGGSFGNTGLNNQYSNLHNGHLGGQSSGASNNQQFGHENVNTGFVQPLPTGGQIYTQVNSDKGYSGGSFGQGSQSLGINDQNYNNGGLISNQGYSNGLGGIGTGIVPNTGLGYNSGIGMGGVGLGGGYMG